MHLDLPGPGQWTEGRFARPSKPLLDDLIELRLQTSTHLIAEHRGVEPVELRRGRSRHARESINDIGFAAGRIAENEALTPFHQ